MAASAAATSAGCAARPKIRAISPAARKPARSAPRSRGPPRFSASRDKARGMSATPFNESRSASARRTSSRKKETESSLAVIAAGSVSGAISRSANRRAPPPVTVRSMALNSEPSRLPDSVRNSSRLARVAGSINRVAPFSSRSGRDSGGRSAFCVFST